MACRDYFVISIFTFDDPPMHGMQHASAAAECMSAGDVARKLCEEGNYPDLTEAIRRAPTLSPDALLVIAHDEVAGGDMQKTLVSEILKRYKQEGHDKNLGSQNGQADFVKKLTSLLICQLEHDKAFFTPSREVYVVNTEQVKYASRGRIAQPC